jgi:hypothetical protein
VDIAAVLYVLELLMGNVLVANAEGVRLEQPGLDVEKEDARLVVLGIVHTVPSRR